MKTLIPKPEGTSWTDDQWLAISARGENILVAAAAGSGKTAVLVERIISMIKDKHADVDRLLIVTFTNAAAAEMRKRIGEALDQELKNHPSSLHLRRQLSLLNKASISTLHSFCIEVLRKYYFLTDLDPGFKIADESEAELLRQEVIEDLFEEEYSKGEEHSFYALVDAYSSDRNDMELQKLVLSLYDFSRSHPDPEGWLQQMAAQYKTEGASIDDLPWTGELLTDITRQLAGLKAYANKALDAAQAPGGPEHYVPALESDAAEIEKLLSSSQSWSSLYDAFQTIEFAKLKTVRGFDGDESLKEKVKKMRDGIKKKTSKIKEDYFERHPDSFLAHLDEMAPVVEELSSLVMAFGSRYSAAKREKGIADFGDLEHYCLQVLSGHGSKMEHPVPSEAAEEYRERFIEVLVDEYQDTNFVQESIIRLVCQDGTEGNLFMVGDVKQSIYRFRLAEPLLFLSKYRSFSSAGGNGLKIDLSKNFRSREDVLHASNFIFKQIMDRRVGEIDYDVDAELKHGASYYPDAEGSETELILINKSKPVLNEEGEDEGESEKSELETVILEARVMAEKIKQLVGADGNQPYMVFDKQTKLMRPVRYKDIVILLRATQVWAPAVLEEFKQQGIPGYAELSSGYFNAVEVRVMMALLQVIDNPLQDIPFAAVLRSPIVGLTGEEMALIRLSQKTGSYYEAAELAAGQGEERWRNKLRAFLESLDLWRVRARSGALSDLIWNLYSETGYYDFAGGMPGGKQRQANLRALYDRAKGYESTSYRGLFRFLRFIERMQDRGKDLGAARALGEQEDVVRIMTIHKSKGLEFPVVFVAGLNKQFNMMDLKENVLLHKELGLGTRYINPKYRVTYPTLPKLAIAQRKKMELIAEEMRVLYVAMTRAKEKLYMIGTVNEAAKSAESWEDALYEEEWMLPDYLRSQAKSYLDWIGPSVIRHKNSGPLRDLLPASALGRGEPYIHETDWKVTMLQAESYEETAVLEEQEKELLNLVRSKMPVPLSSENEEEVRRRLQWTYNFSLSSTTRSKQSVTEIKKQHQVRDEYSSSDLVAAVRQPLHERPAFMSGTSMNAAESGTAMHLVMQHLDYHSAETEQEIKEQIQRMTAKEILTTVQAENINVSAILSFLRSPIGLRVKQSADLRREIPFSMSLPITEVNPKFKGDEEEKVLVQGVIDCLIREEDGYILIDYKTDGITNRFAGGYKEAENVLRNRYTVQISLYEKAISRILKAPVKEAYLYFFDGGHTLKMK
ncbi:helicase-exonuclease AddAB subunit AddA [Fictibacillus aquaticus]|uniref:ATP-dependent helicase/nuclease subunit A n=1 Tax=Fictibacillus aquaticus TaxID=2021314 RepID=A0A235FD37_9BACL|nr:helicase-exonuclease AddAB subunit AddA [Fictibacillus aquaticus]OYD59129.1 helicase-exonuclease AddAB subunit AddA [Fictibacillus aquaticus]